MWIIPFKEYSQDQALFDLVQQEDNLCAGSTVNDDDEDFVDYDEDDDEDDDDDDDDDDDEDDDEDDDYDDDGTDTVVDIDELSYEELLALGDTAGKVREREREKKPH